MGPWPQPSATGDDDDSTPAPAACDGLLQDAERGIIDSLFDEDGDGAVDGNNPDCAAVYPPHLLDCDDGDSARSPLLDEFPCNTLDDDCDPTSEDEPDKDGDGSSFCDDCDDDDPARSPSAIEQCWDNVDNDCDLVIDPECIDYQGLFALETTLEFSCTIIDVVLSQFEIVWNPPDTASISNPYGWPTSFEGMLGEDGSFELSYERVLGYPGSCDEYYTLSGQFLDEDTFTADFIVDFVGIPTDFWCLSCEDQLFEGLQGTRVPE